MTVRQKIMVGISGGVDSAVAALLLLRQGHEIHGLHMTNWQDDDGYCTAADDYRQARRVCEQLGIPLHRVQFAAEYRELVFADFLREYRAGRTPNPDVLCNRLIKFGSFLAHARRLGADCIATGHYARIMTGEPAGLLKAADAAKDQTYFLHNVDAAALAVTRFPLGDLTKAEVRRIAHAEGLPNHARADSTGICFIGERPFREFLGRYIEALPGPMLTDQGEAVGSHRGVAFYTIGQRCGLGIGGRRTSGEPWYVVCKEVERNVLVVVQGRNHPLLWSDRLQASGVHWIRGIPQALASGTELACRARIRHRHPEAPCLLVRLDDDTWEVRFEQPQWAVTPGQYVVFYQEAECLGGGIIASASRRHTGTAPIPAALPA
jgi:tRNA-specific 2-thiouridylase